MTYSRLLHCCFALLACLGAVRLCLAADAPVLRNNQLTLSCDTHNGSCTAHWSSADIGPFAASVELSDGKHFATTDFPKHQIEPSAHPDELTIRHFGLKGAPVLIQHISLPDGQPYILTDLEVLATHPVGTRHISPLVLATNGSADIQGASKPTVLFVPFDNDMWVHYNEPIDPAKDPDSYEVTAIFDNGSRHGLVLGSITHDLWKTGILARNISNSRIQQLEVYGGATGHWSHDAEPHGLVSGTDIKSPTILVGYFTDWRNGLEAYGRENARIKPPLAWKDGVPFGWNSWAAYLEKIDMQKYEGVADFIHNQLEPRGYQNNNTAYINWDSGWNKFSEADLRAAATHVHSLGEKAGIYYTPFSYWSDDLSKEVEGTNGKYHYSDIILRDSHGQPLPKVDGARPLDPTNPGTLARIDWQLAQFVAWGYDSVKLDFLNCGAQEGHHYDPAIATGVAAYNLGMKRIESDLDPAKIGRSFFISLSIAPLFPAYGHARRISCDAFGRIQDSDYLLNAASYSWWANGTLYDFNDPDHTVIARDTDPYHGEAVKGSIQTFAEARTRVNATVISGTLLIDSDDLLDGYGQSRAKELLTNKAVLDVARAGIAFRPVEGNSGIHASPEFVREEKDGSLYLAVFNYSETKPATLTVDLQRLGLDPAKTYRATDLWTGTEQDVTSQMQFLLGPAESRLLHLVAR
ncbi:alpha-galactosidase [Acidicapsa dinghuensis]|uniref:Alpha-galactosidase n=1 Tax=Acidicapsa dinghuensis TaxID=2218256 RepID=A0ABW1EKA2_9BACT|nr:hypothetical protein [Acidicapsa dinghuensis]